MECKDIIRLMEELAPVRYACDWDNVGLLVGSQNKKVSRLMLALDPSEEVIDQAVREGVDMLITHHPLIFGSIKRVNSNDVVGRKILKLIKNDISYYAAHTNLDSAVMAEEVGKMFGLVNTNILSEEYSENLYKLCTFVPLSHAIKVRDAMTREGAGHIGQYSNCTFNVEGMGTFKPLEGTSPYIGKINETANAQEMRIEVTTTKDKLDRVIKAMLKVHPYEEVAYDIYKLENVTDKKGIGIRGYIDNDMTLEEFAIKVKQVLNADVVRVCGDPLKKVVKIAVSPGSGKSVVEDALKANVDVLVTGDIGHHAALDAREQGLAIIDAGHFITEYFVVDYLRDYLIDKIYNTDEDLYTNSRKLEIVKAEEKEPFTYIS